MFSREKGRTRMKQAVVEIGTNSVKYTVAELSDGVVSFVKDVNTVTRLGEGLKDSGMLSAEAMERTARVVADYVEQAHEDGAEQIEVVGTMALRSAGNSSRFEVRVKELAHIGLRIISGEEEARLSFESVLCEVPKSVLRDLLVFDLGGGSTEFVYSCFGKITRAFSVNIGSVELTEKFLPEAPAPLSAVSRLKAVIRAELVKNGVKGRPACLVGTGGNLTTLFMLKSAMPEYDAENLSGMTVSKTELEALIKELACRTLDERRAMQGMNPARADIVLAGACAVSAVMEITESRSLMLSLRGLRHALLAEMLSR